jgi:O-acetylserine/cysteine efflux transporter
VLFCILYSGDPAMPIADLLQALVVVLVWGVNFVVIKWGVADVPPLLLGAMRFTLAAFPALLFIRKPALPWRWLAAYGLTMGVGQFALLFTAIKLGMPAGLASVVLQSQAFFTLLIAAAWLGERWQPAQLLGLLCALAGLVLIGIGKGGSLGLIGFALTIAAALCWATSNVVVRAIGRAGYKPDPLALVVWASLIPPLPFLGLSLAFDGADKIAYTLTHLTGSALFATCYLAFVATLLGYALWSRLLTRHPAGKVAPFSLLVPVVGLATAALVLGERLNGWQAAGSLMLMAGLLLNVFGQRWLARTGLLAASRS